jgi:hypothetical protein
MTPVSLTIQTVLRQAFGELAEPQRPPDIERVEMFKRKDLVANVLVPAADSILWI